ncbi:YlbD family protein [Metabacillus idriensis]|uniref:YlbD family protein n=1 Tax=Metabacillus idriensis TaxID=324768 RepID=UPI00163995C3|nr:YlbD family protein [Metabacillus idriensis]QNG58903.1 YlbD family protein [Bacillus sp. PAMC26568]
MTEKKEHPSIGAFKEFVRKHPKLIAEVRKGDKKWQELYEDWYLLGENDTSWKKYQEVTAEEESADNTKADFMSKMMTAVKSMDANQMNQHLYNMNNTISSIQNLFSTFGLTKGSSKNQSNPSNHPFSFRKD